MKEDYLWDKTGEPDPEIQELERVLGALRYQPRPLEIPADLASGSRSTFLPRLLAIAATIAIVLLGVGLWFAIQQTQQINEIHEVSNKPVKTVGGSEEVAAKPDPKSNPTPVGAATEPKDKIIRHRVNPVAISHQLAINRRMRMKVLELTPNERKEAEAAREQLMLALRVASTKLNFAQKKAQEINTENQTHNQHKVG